MNTGELELEFEKLLAGMRAKVWERNATGDLSTEDAHKLIDMIDERTADSDRGWNGSTYCP
jgi:hypothetical protein